MRKKMYRNDMFYLHYPYDPKVAKLVRQVCRETRFLSRLKINARSQVFNLCGGCARSCVGAGECRRAGQ